MSHGLNEPEESDADALLSGALRHLFRVDSPLEADGRGQDARSDRYELLREVGRGGMGVVYEAFDHELEREVAIKVLASSRGGAVRYLRFREEGTIAGSLQHPGIVPVYDRGQLRDGRPFLAMRFVAGETLESRLRSVGDDAAERRTLLPVLQRVCEAVGYAHARRIVHRDLKPSNVMVGEFGEVSVLDWGLARRVGGTDPSPSSASGSSPSSGSLTVTGSVLGTPAYMSPEQASGSARDVDTTADVFAIGAMLFELETGRRVVRDGAGLVPAGRDLRMRLLEASVDGEIADLIVTCLDADPGRRPSHAGLVAATLREWLASRDEKARLFALEAAESRGRATQERRVRRLTQLTSVVLLCAAGIGFWAWRAREEDRLQTQRGALSRVEEALQEAALERESALVAGEGAVAAWSEAAQAASRARQELARAEAAPELLRKRVEDADRLASEQSRLAVLHDQERRRNALMVERLDALREPGDDGRDLHRVDAGSAEAYREHGLDLESEGLEEVTRRIAASPIRDALVRGLALWAGVRGRLETEGDSTRRPLARALFDAVLASEAHPASRRVLELASDSTRIAEILEMSDDELRSVPPGFALMAADGLGLVMGPSSAVAFLRRVSRWHRGDFFVAFQLAYWARVAEPRLMDAELEGLIAGAAIRPGHPFVLCRLANLRRQRGQSEDALALLRDVVREHPDFPLGHFNLGVAYIALNRHGEAEPCIAEALRLDPAMPQAWCNLGFIHLRRQEYAEAARLFEEALRRSPWLFEAQANLGGEHKRKGRVADAAELLQAAWEQRPDFVSLGIVLAQQLAGIGRPHLARRILEEVTPAIEGPAPSVRQDIARLTAALRRRESSLEDRALAEGDVGEEDDELSLLGLVEAAWAKGDRASVARWCDRLGDSDTASPRRFRRDWARVALGIAAADPAGAAIWNGRALRWLEADLEVIESWPVRDVASRPVFLPSAAGWNTVPFIDAFAGTAPWMPADAKAVWAEAGERLRRSASGIPQDP